MGVYVDGFIVPVPKKKLKEYLALAKVASKVWRKHGALEYVECAPDDVKKGKWTSFPRSVKLKSNEVVVFSYIVYKNRKSRDQVLKKVMADPKLAHQWENMPFDGKRMIYGGFKTMVVA